MSRLISYNLESNHCIAHIVINFEIYQLVSYCSLKLSYIVINNVKEWTL